MLWCLKKRIRCLLDWHHGTKKQPQNEQPRHEDRLGHGQGGRQATLPRRPACTLVDGPLRLSKGIEGIHLNHCLDVSLMSKSHVSKWHTLVCCNDVSETSLDHYANLDFVWTMIGCDYVQRRVGDVFPPPPFTHRACLWILTCSFC